MRVSRIVELSLLAPPGVIFCYYKEAIKLATSVGVGYYKVINNLTKGVL
jgi:hypothetical protein